jgi:predicted phosphodiesterase
MKKILVIPDVHCKPGVSNERLEWLSQYIVAHLPDIIVCLGDWWDMHSLNAYDKPGAKSLEGVRYDKDIVVGIEGMVKLFWHIDLYNKRRKKKYKPKLVFLLGNHEERINRFIENEPKFEKVVNISSLALQDFGWEVHPYREVVEIEGVLFCHNFTSGLTGREISGDNAAKRLVQVNHKSSVAGHSHLLQLHTESSRDGQRRWGLVAGCYFSHDVGYVDMATQHMYWRGVTMLHEVHNGDFAPMFVTLDYLRTRFK